MSMIRDLRAAVRPTLRRGVAASYQHGYPPPSAVVDCAVYRDGRRLAAQCGPREALALARAQGPLSQHSAFVWIGLYEPAETEFSGIAQEFGLHPLAVEDAIHAHQRPKLESYDDSLFTVLKTVRYVEHADLTATSEVVDTGEIMVFTGPDFVITVRHGCHGSLRPLRHRLEANSELLAKGPSAVLHAISDQVVDNCLAVTEALRDDIDEVELEVFSAGIGKGRRADAGRIYQLKREVLEFKRAVGPMLAPMQMLSERPIHLIDPDIQKYFRDVADHVARVGEQVVSFDDLLDSILQANLAQVSVAQNEDMRKISAWAAILTVPTMVFGLYGMNFEYFPELHWRFGYPLVLSVTVAICAGIRHGFRRNGWL